MLEVLDKHRIRVTVSLGIGAFEAFEADWRPRATMIIRIDDVGAGWFTTSRRELAPHPAPPVVGRSDAHYGIDKSNGI